MTSLSDAARFAFPLAGMALIRVTGDDACTFLHGQFTNTVRKSDAGVKLAGYCSPRGRLLALMRVWETPEAVMLLLPEDIAESFLKRIRIYVLRARVKFERVEDPSLFVFVGTGGEALLKGHLHGLDLPAEPGAIVRSPMGELLRIEDALPFRALPAGPRYLWNASIPSTHTGFDGKASEQRWIASEIAAGVPVISEAVRELFVPQTVNLEKLGGVDFKKGCYPGQEVISRMQYVGETKRRLARFAAPAGVDVRPGSDLYAGNDPAGYVVASAVADGTLCLLGSVETKAESLSLSPQGPALERL